jgi:hypothetical protein
MFKAMLLQQWFALNAVEFDFDIQDRLSFRAFVGVGPHEAPPLHEAVCAFRRLLVERGVFSEITDELQAQLMGSRQPDTPGAGRQARENAAGLSVQLPGFASLFAKSALLGPAEWESLEQVLVDYWTRKCLYRGAPRLRDIKLADEPKLKPYFTLVRVVSESAFQYEYVGTEVEKANAGRLTGAVLDDKVDENLDRFGHAGLQGELLALCRRTVSRRGPVTTSTFFTNAAGVKCQLWTIQAPLMDDTDTVVMLMGAALIKAVSIN